MGAEREEEMPSGLEDVRRAILEAETSSHSLPATKKATRDPGGVIEIGIAYGREKRHWLEWAVDEFAATAEGRRILINLIPMGSMESSRAILDGDERIHVWAPASKVCRDTFVRDRKDGTCRLSATSTSPCSGRSWSRAVSPKAPRNFPA